ncbi:heavy-metal-associated domain-containing protein [Paenibacillus endoradicis]|uniref:heavy-metal-associated domain-containing protein n=1 Tax=Paenibacillus endoradicis TaxID=2972487 RepID=UPI002158D629|nr:cation transporter [Paenibacillus endoradicis]MCR8656453.1 cation transporter [Paenibacillus endoradicis]
MQEAIVKVEGMSCRSCVNKIEGALDAIGVEANVNMKDGTVNVTFDASKIDLAVIEGTIKANGYSVSK